MKTTQKSLFLLVPALLLAALVFTGCPMGDDDDGSAPNVFGTTSIQRVVFGDDKFVATGKDGSAWHSADGVTWKASTDKTALGIANLSGLTFGDGKFLATGSGHENLARAYSDDGGVTWKASGNGFNAKGLAYGNGVFITGGGSGALEYSSDPTTGSSWAKLENTATTFSEGNGYINGMAFGDGKFVAVGGNRGHAAYSTNGSTWTGITQTEAIFGGWINGIAFGGGRFVAVGSGGKIAYSSPTSVENWTAVVDTTFEGEILNITYGNGYFVAVGDTGAAAKSADGIIWSAINTAFGEDAINGVAYGKGKFVMVGANGKVASVVVK
jgi:hypothetical protein